MQHRHWKTGQPCSCTFGRTVLTRTASKLDWLRKRPDLQTPEGIRFLRLLNRYQQGIGDKVDPLLPWLAREWKRGRLVHDVDPERADRAEDFANHSAEPGAGVGGAHVGHLYYPEPIASDVQQFGRPSYQRRPLYDQELSHWADWYNHPLGRGNLDMGSKQFQVPQMYDAIDTWDQRMKEEAEKAQLQEQADAPVLHQYPDGWKLQRLLPKHLDYEGDVMGHCVGGFGYEQEVQNGNTAIVSLRDPQGRPHVTMELEPNLAWPNGAKYYPDFDVDKAIEANPVTRATPEYIKEGLRQLHDQVGDLPDDERHAELQQQYPLPVSGTDLGALYQELRREHERNATVIAPLDKAKIVQIQGKGNEVPKPEYQQRLKDWFQTFPEAQRPNWDYRSSEINHVGSFVPDATSMVEAPRWAGNDWKEVEGDPNVNDDEDWAEGGYGPHGDYGLVDNRPVDWESTLRSLVRPQSHQDMEYGWNTYHPKEAQAVYQEALKRNQIPHLGAAWQKFDEHGMEEFNKAQDREMMYNPEYPSYPGESPDEDSERWEGASDEWGEPIDPQEAFQNEYDRYRQAEEELSQNHPWFRAADDMYRWLRPHMDDQGNYRGPPPGTNYLDPAVRAQALGLQPSGDPMAFVKDLPEGTEFMGQDGQVHRVTQTSPLHVNGYPPTYSSTFASDTPMYVKYPQSQPGTFSKAARAAHPHITTGRPCTCPWGPDNPPSFSRTASKIEWLMSRGDKFSQTPKGQQTLATLQELVRLYPTLDPLAPWIMRECKKGRLEADGLRLRRNDENGGEIYPRDMRVWADWFNSKSRSRRGVDIMQLDVNGLYDKLREWEQEKQEEEDRERMRRGTVVHDFGDGWTVRRVDNRDQAHDEGDQMGNCVGSYGSSIENGNVGIFSLRDPRNLPHATVEIHPDEADDRDKNGLVHPTGRIHQIQGKENDEPIPEYRDRLAEWFRQAPVWAGKKLDIPTPTDVYDLRHWWEPEESDEDYDPYQLSPGQAYDYGLDYDYEYNRPDPDWRSIIQDNLDSVDSPHAYNSQDDASEIRDIAYNSGHQEAYEEALDRHYEQLQKEFYDQHYDPKEYEGPAQVQWNNWEWGKLMHTLSGGTKGLSYGPNGELYDQPHPINPGQAQLFQQLSPDDWTTSPTCPTCGENNTTRVYADTSGTHYCGNCRQNFTPPEYQYPQYQEPTWEDSAPRPLTFSRTTSLASDPLYYRWAFSPVTGQVVLSHNLEDSPRLHGDLARDLNEPGLVHGYAYRIGGGWRLLDWENRPLEDPFVIAQVMRKLRDEEGYQPSDEEWEDMTADYSRQHHGMPLPPG